MLNSFHDTTAMPRLERELAERLARTQETAVLQFFRAHPNTDFTREVIEATFDLPTQSASRVLANLTARGLLEKSPAAQVIGRYGRRAHTWRLARPSSVGQGRLFS